MLPPISNYSWEYSKLISFYTRYYLCICVYVHMHACADVCMWAHVCQRGQRKT